jgi:hypothetical protein
MYAWTFSSSYPTNSITVRIRLSTTGFSNPFTSLAYADDYYYARRLQITFVLLWLNEKNQQTRLAAPTTPPFTPLPERYPAVYMMPSHGFEGTCCSA